MKKLFMVFTLGMLAIVLVGCGGGNLPNEEEIHADATSLMRDNASVEAASMEFSSPSMAEYKYYEEDPNRVTLYLTMYAIDTAGYEYAADMVVDVVYTDDGYVEAEWEEER